MLIIDAINIKKYFGDRLILSFEELKIRSGDKIGIVGQNGAGKTTLMNILSGELLPDEGLVKKYCDMSYIRQFSDEVIDADSRTLAEFEVQSKIGSQNISGGERARLKIAGALSKKNILLLADEPTANLDFKGLQLLKGKLLKAESLVLISHDRDILDSVCNRIIEVSDGNLTFYNGNYSFYCEQKRNQVQREWFEYGKFIEEKKHLVQAIDNRQTRARTLKKTPTRMGNSEARLHKRSTTEIQQKLFQAANSLKTRLDKLEEKSKPQQILGIKLDFSLTHPPHNKIVIYGQDFSFSYGNRKIFDKTGFKVQNGLKQAILGDNGTGKTTLLNQIYHSYKGQLNELPISIHIVPKAVVGYFYQSFENLRQDKTVLENVMEDSIQNETTVRTILARLLFSADDVYKKVAVLSGGERIKVSFAKLFVSNANVLLLDEPTNYLDMDSIKALQSILREYEGTVLFVSHDKAFVKEVADRLLIIRNNSIVEFEGRLSEYEN